MVSSCIAMGSRRAAAALFLILLIKTALFVPFLAEPMESDEGVYACAASVLADGGLPYRDIFDHKPPAIYFLYAGVFRALSPSLESLRLFTLCFSLLTTLAVFAAGKLLWDRRAALAAAFLYALFSGGPALQGTSANAETFMVLPMILALICFIGHVKRLAAGGRLPPWLFLAGLLSGAAIMFKQVAGANFLVLLAFAAADKERGTEDCAKFAAGAVIIPVCFAAYFAFYGAFWDFFYSGFLVNAKYAASASDDWVLRLKNAILVTATMAKYENIWLWAYGFLGAATLMRGKTGGEERLTLAWTGASLLPIGATGMFFGHYYIQAVPGLCLLSGRFLETFARKSLLKRKAVFACASALPLIHVLPFQLPFYSRYAPEKISEVKYNSKRFAVSKRLAEEFQKFLRPEDGVFVWAASPELYFYLGRRSPTKYVSYQTWRHEPEIMAGILRDVKKAAPAYIVWTSFGLKDPGLLEYIDKNYSFFLRIEDWTVFKRRGKLI